MERLQALRSDFTCSRCTHADATGSTDETEAQLFANHPSECGYRAWQQAALYILEEEIAQEILAKLQQIQAYRNTVSCHMCGMCCRLASSDASYPELLERAAQGDDFAQQFTSIFLPYSSRQAAAEKYPEGVAAVLAHVGEPSGGSSAEALSSASATGISNPHTNAQEDANSANAKPDERVYFYHCPYIGEDNRCTLYGTDQRPALCETYPETPLGFVYDKCAWKPWQNDTHMDTLLAHAMLNLCEAWSQKLHVVLA